MTELSGSNITSHGVLGGFLLPSHFALCGPGVGIALHSSEAGKKAIEQWLDKRSRKAIFLPMFAFDDLLSLVESGVVPWIVVYSVEDGVAGEHFPRLWYSLTRTDTELWVAETDACLSDKLFPILLDYQVTLLEMGCALIAPQNDGQQMLVSLHSMVADMHRENDFERREFARKVASLTETERELYNAADEDTPMSAEEICKRTTATQFDSWAKTCLSNLTKLGLLKKIKGKKGYLRVPPKS